MAFTIKAYVLNDGGDVVTSWVGRYGQQPKVMARMDALMIHLRQQPKDGWIRPYYDTLSDGIGEVRFKVMNILHRPLGFFGPDRNDFTFLFFATKKAKFDPPNAIDTAVSRKAEIENGSAGVIRITRWES